MFNPTSAIIYKLSEFPALHRIQSTLRENLCRIYPTRYLAINPPAQAVRVSANSLDIPSLQQETPLQAIVAFLPADFAPYLSHMSVTLPQVCVHPDIGLQSQAAYLSYGAPVRAGCLPLTLWLELSELMAAHGENIENGAVEGVPVVLVAGESMVVAWFAPNETQLQRCRNALTAALQRPVGHGAGDIVKAQQKAERYGERPWLFMRYELKAGEQRRAVNWAPFGRLQSDTTSH